MATSTSGPIVKEVLRFEDLPLGSLGTRRAVVRWSDGSESETFSWYSDSREQLRSLQGPRLASVVSASPATNARTLGHGPGGSGEPVAALGLRHFAGLGELGERRAHGRPAKTGRRGDITGGDRLTGGQRREDSAPGRA